MVLPIKWQCSYLLVMEIFGLQIVTYENLVWNLYGLTFCSAGQSFTVDLNKSIESLSLKERERESAERRSGSTNPDGISTAQSPVRPKGSPINRSVLPPINRPGQPRSPLPRISRPNAPRLTPNSSSASSGRTGMRPALNLAQLGLESKPSDTPFSNFSRYVYVRIRFV
jgi:hypothetical protein